MQFCHCVHCLSEIVRETPDRREGHWPAGNIGRNTINKHLQSVLIRQFKTIELASTQKNELCLWIFCYAPPYMAA